MTIDVVVSRFNEDISWTNTLRRDCRLTVYNKGDGPEPRLPNVGREAHTYLHHILTRGTGVADWTFFSQADPNRHMPFSLIQGIINGFPDTSFRSALHLDKGPMFFVSEPVRYVERKAQGDDKDNGCEEVWRQLFTHEPPADILFAPAAIFAISSARLLSRSPAFYGKAMELAAARPRGPWEFERLWAYLWRDKDTPFLRL
jgi:hypothetical protein